MRPNDLYNWYCVFHSVTVIFRHAGEIRMHQIAACVSSKGRQIEDSTTFKAVYKDESAVDLQSKRMDRPLSTSIEDSHPSRSTIWPRADQSIQHINLHAPVVPDNEGYMEPDVLKSPKMARHADVSECTARRDKGSLPALVLIDRPAKIPDTEVNLNPSQLTEIDHIVEVKSFHETFGPQEQPIPAVSTFLLSG